ncbi:hypothetical protein GCM10023237_21880 [Streptomyces coeruleoprunus]
MHALGYGLVADDAIDLAVHEQALLLDVVHGPPLDLRSRKAFSQLVQEYPQRRERGDVRAEHHTARVRVRLSLGGTTQVFDGIHHGAHLRQQRLSRRCQLHPAGGTLHEGHAQVLLQGADLAAERGLTDEQPLCRRPKCNSSASASSRRN